MNKICTILVLLLGFYLVGCNNSKDDVNDPHEHEFVEGVCGCGEKDPNYQESHNHEYIDGVCSCGDKQIKLTEQEAIENAIKSISLPTETEEHIALPKNYTEEGLTVYISWQSGDLSVINNYGYIKRKNFEQSTELYATFECGKIKKEVSYSIVVLAYNDEYRVQAELDKISVDTVLTEKTKLQTRCIDSDINIEWELSNPEIFDNEGCYNFPDNVTIMKLTVILTLNDIELTKEFNMVAYKETSIEKKNTQNIIDSKEAFDDGVLIDLEKNENECLVLKYGKQTGTYISPVVETSQFDTLVGSWSAITSQNTGAIEVYFRVLVDGVWSDYFTYGQWRLGDKNKGVSKISSNGVARMEEDTVFTATGKNATAYQYKVEFRRLEEGNESPKLRLVACCIRVIGYEELKLDYTLISQKVFYDVPILNQNIVPIIGNSICSPTSTTMLLKYYGHSFNVDGYAYEHQYVAQIAKDYGHNMFGNWVYNVAVMGSYGEYAYVKRFINNDELMWHLENIGPVALSVKGNMQGYYNTAGHLIVCKGYKIVDGEVVFICNDPNLKDVEVEYTYETIENVWREIAYVIEPNK
jgi:hypothetical protein